MRSEIAHVLGSRLCPCLAACGALIGAVLLRPVHLPLGVGL